MGKKRSLSYTSNDQLSVSKLQKKIRDTERFLNRQNIPPQIIVEQERKLSSLKLSLKEAFHARKQCKYEQKYKMIKFFEQRKLSKKILQIRKEIEKDEIGKQELETKLSLLYRQYNYIMHFPKDIPYISLFPRTPCCSPELLGKKEKIMTEIETKVTKGELENVAQELNHVPTDCGKDSCCHQPRKCRSTSDAQDAQNGCDMCGCADEEISTKDLKKKSKVAKRQENGVDEEDSQDSGDDSAEYDEQDGEEDDDCEEDDAVEEDDGDEPYDDEEEVVDGQEDAYSEEDDEE